MIFTAGYDSGKGPVMRLSIDETPSVPPADAECTRSRPLDPTVQLIYPSTWILTLCLKGNDAEALVVYGCVDMKAEEMIKSEGMHEAVLTARRRNEGGILKMEGSTSGAWHPTTLNHPGRSHGNPYREMLMLLGGTFKHILQK